jgi:DNA-binding Lrp family transcriptional regulator
MFDQGNNLTDLQREILDAYDRNPDADAAAVAKIVGCSESYARETIEEHRDAGWQFGL